jgi:hypothetical protein
MATITATIIKETAESKVGINVASTNGSNVYVNYVGGLFAETGM